MYKYYHSIPILFLLTNLINEILSEDVIYKIKDFRSNPMGIAQREDLFNVDLGIPSGSRVLAYVDFNSDK